MQIMPGVFYEFHRYRVISRAGQPIKTKDDCEAGPIINQESALHQLRNGKDIYTFRRRDAKGLAAQVYAADPHCERPHGPAFFMHFHPGGVHPEFPRRQEGRPRAQEGPGHVFFGTRGENYNALRPGQEC